MILNNMETMRVINDKLRNEERFCFVRYGDGCYISMYQDSVNKTIGRSNKSVITPEIRKKIIDSHNVVAPDYMIGTLKDINHPRSAVNNINFKKVEVEMPDTMYSAIAFQESFLEFTEVFAEFLKNVQKKRTLYINHYIENVLIEKLNIYAYVKTNKFNACAEWKRVLEDIAVLQKDCDQIVLSCGQLARVIASDLYKMYPDKTIIDLGSTSDMLVVGTESFSKIAIRGHISNNIEKIKSINNTGGFLG